MSGCFSCCILLPCGISGFINKAARYEKGFACLFLRGCRFELLHECLASVLCSARLGVESRVGAFEETHLVCHEFVTVQKLLLDDATHGATCTVELFHLRLVIRSLLRRLILERSPRFAAVINLHANVLLLHIGIDLVALVKHAETPPAAFPTCN